MIIEGEKINLRQVKPTDFAQIIKWNKNELLTYFVGNKLPKTVEECEIRYLKTYNPHNRILAIEDKEGRIIGEIEIDHIRWKEKQAELFMYIGEENLWGKGYGFDALTVFINYIFNMKGFNNIYLRVYEHNKRAIRCYEKCGFKKRGILRFKKGKIHSDNLILMDIDIKGFKNKNLNEAFF